MLALVDGRNDDHLPRFGVRFALSLCFPLSMVGLVTEGTRLTSLVQVRYSRTRYCTGSDSLGSDLQKKTDDSLDFNWGTGEYEWMAINKDTKYPGSDRQEQLCIGFLKLQNFRSTSTQDYYMCLLLNIPVIRKD